MTRSRHTVIAAACAQALLAGVVVCSAATAPPTAGQPAAKRAVQLADNPAPIDPSKALLKVDEVNATIRKHNPDGVQFDRPDPVETAPRDPADYPGGAGDPCNWVAAIDFAGGQPAPVGYAAGSMGAPRQRWLIQVAANYDSPQAAAAVFARTAQNIRACSAATDRAYLLSIGAITPTTLTYRRNPNLKVDMPNRHVESSEYRLRGSTIVAVSTTEPDTVAGTAAAQIESRIS